MDDNILVHRWVDGVHTRRMDRANFYFLYTASVKNMLGTLRQGMVDQGYPVYNLPTLLDNLDQKIVDGELYWFVGPTWISVVGYAEDWHSPGMTLVEELVGPRFSYQAVDMADYVSAMTELAKDLKVPSFQIGMLANPRKQAMLRYLTSLGMEHTTSIVSKKV